MRLIYAKLASHFQFTSVYFNIMVQIEFLQNPQKARSSIAKVSVALLAFFGLWLTSFYVLHLLTKQPNSPSLGFNSALWEVYPPLVLAIMLIALPLLIVLQLRHFGSVVMLTPDEILYRTNRSERRVKFADVQSMHVIQDGRGRVVSLTIKEGRWRALGLAHFDEMEHLAAMIERSLPRTTVVQTQTASLRPLASILIPVGMMLSLIAFQTVWRSAPAIDILIPAIAYPFAIWMIASGIVEMRSKSLQEATANRFNGKLSIFAALFCICLAIVYALRFSPQFDANNSCSLRNRGASGCVRFIGEAQVPFRFGDNANTVLYAMKHGVMQREFGRFQRGTTSFLFTDTRGHYNDELQIGQSAAATRYMTYDRDDILVWEAGRNVPLLSIESHPTQHRMLSADGQLLAYSDWRQVSNENNTTTTQTVVVVKDVVQQHAIATYDDAHIIAFPNAETLILMSKTAQSQQLLTVNPHSGTVAQSVEIATPLDQIEPVAASQDVSLFAIVDGETVFVFRVADGSLVTSLALDSEPDTVFPMGGVFSADNQTLFLSHRQAYSEDTIELLAVNLENGEQLLKQDVITDGYVQPFNLDISADDSTLGVATSDGLFLYDVDQLRNRAATNQ